MPYSLDIPKIYAPYFESKKPVQIWYGSRFSAKSWTKCVMFLVQMSKPEYCRIVFARDTQKNVKNSQYQLFKDIAKRFWFPGTFTFFDSTNKIVHNGTGNFAIGGSFEMPDSLRSVADPTDFWAEEPITRTNSIKREDYLDIRGSLRNSYGIPVRFHFTFNPISINTWIYKEFFVDKRDDVEILLVNYDNNQFCPQTAKDYLLSIKETDYKRYLVEAQGEWGIPTPEEPFWAVYNRNPSLYSAQDIGYIRNMPVTLTFDFNIYSSLLSTQHFDPIDNERYRFAPDETKGGIRFVEAKRFRSDGTFRFKEFVRAELLKIKQNFSSDYRGIMVRIGGDRSGNARGTGKNPNFVEIENICKELGISYKIHPDIVGSKRNWGLRESRTICEWAFEYYKNNIQISLNCENFEQDLQMMRLDELGDKLDKDHANKQDYGHVGDCGRYVIEMWENVNFKRGESMPALHFYEKPIQVFDPNGAFDMIPDFKQRKQNELTKDFKRKNSPTRGLIA